jgi:hypothetical protein
MPEFTVVATFNDASVAQRAASELDAAGIPASRVRIAFPMSPVTRAGHTERVLWRLLLQVVWWSIVGGAIGLLVGLAFWHWGVGPSGLDGFWVQVATWMIFGHLLLGIWAGYLVLGNQADLGLRESAERGATVSVRCDTRAEIERAEQLLRPHGPSRMSRVASG